jgi:hypothetical protein
MKNISSFNIGCQDGVDQKFTIADARCALQRPTGRLACPAARYLKLGFLLDGSVERALVE